MSRYAYAEQPPVDCLTIGPGRVARWEMPVYWYTHGRPQATGPRDEQRQVERDPVQAAKRSRRRAMDAAGWLWLRSRGQWIETPQRGAVYFRQGFWTLTLPEAAPERNARRALSAFWTWARNRANVDAYLWAAELTGRGRVHFHAIVNTFVSVDRVRAAWMRALDAEGCLMKHYTEPPTACVKMERVNSAAQAKQYTAKYLGKAFGNDRVRQLSEIVAQIAVEVDNRRTDAELARRLVEAQHRLREAQQYQQDGVKRWAASQNLNRPPVTLNAAEDAETMRRLSAELRTVGARWCPKGDRGQAGFFDLGNVDRTRTPVLSSLLYEAAGVPAKGARIQR